MHVSVFFSTDRESISFCEDHLVLILYYHVSGKRYVCFKQFIAHPLPLYRLFSGSFVTIQQVKRSNFTLGSCHAFKDDLTEYEKCEQSFLSSNRVTLSFFTGYIDLADMSGSEG